MYSDVAKPDLIQWWNTFCMLTTLIEHLTVLLEYFDQLISMAGIANTREDLTLHSLPMVTSLVYDQGWGDTMAAQAMVIAISGRTVVTHAQQVS